MHLGQLSTPGSWLAASQACELCHLGEVGRSVAAAASGGDGQQGLCVPWHGAVGGPGDRFPCAACAQANYLGSVVVDHVAVGNDLKDIVTGSGRKLLDYRVGLRLPPADRQLRHPGEQC